MRTTVAATGGAPEGRLIRLVGSPTKKDYKIHMKTDTLALSPSRPTARGPRWKAPLIGLAALALAGGGWSVMHRGAAPATAATAPAAAAKIPVHELASGDVAAIGLRALTLSLPLSGSLTPLTQATIKSKASGAVQESVVQEGMAVAAGQVLVRLDVSDLNARLTQQQANLDDARAKLSIANKNEANNQTLLKQKYISQSAYDTTQNNVELAQAAVKSAAAQVEIARIALADTVIRAPISGIVSKRYVQAGEKVAPDSPVFTIVNLNQMTLEAQVPASDIPRVKVGQEVRFKVDGYPARDFAGKVARINPTAEVGSRAMLVYIAVDNRDGALRGGMFAKGAITTDRAAVMPLLPLAALRTENGRSVVYQIVANKVVAQPVTLGLRNDDEGYAEVTAGLRQGNQVLVAKLDGVKPGHSVKLPAGMPPDAASGAAAVASAAPRAATKG